MSEFAYVGSELELFAQARNWKNYWASQVVPYMGQRVFDVGAGQGANLAQLWQPGANWLCIEPDARLAQLAEEAVAQAGRAGSCQVLVGTLDDLDPAQSADTILYIDVIEHIEDHQAELRRAAERLRPGGHLIVLVPAHQWLYSPFDDAVGHFRRYTRQSLAAAAPPSLRLERLRYLDSVGFLASAMNKLVLKSSLPSPSQIALWDRGMVPFSRLFDRIFAYRAGKSVLGIWQAPGG